MLDGSTASTRTRLALVLAQTSTPRSRNGALRRVEQLARIVPVQRAGYGEGVAIPSVVHAVRALLKSGGDASHLVPRAVLKTIRDAGTYR